MKKTLSLTVLMFLGLSLTASAGSRLMSDKPWEFNVHVGKAILQSDLGDTYKDSLVIQLSADQELNSWLSYGGQFGYTPNHKFEGNGYTSDTKLQILQLTPELKAGKWETISGTTWKRYAVLGAGFYTVRTTDGELRINALPGFSGRVNGRTSSYLGMNAGVGLAFQVSKFMAIGLDVRYHDIFAAGDDIKYWLPSLTLTRLFN